MTTSYASGRTFEPTDTSPQARRDDEQARVIAVLADIATMVEHSGGREPASIACCFVGDARTPMARTLLLTAALLGMDIRVAAPRALWPWDEIITLAQDMAARTGAGVLVTSDAGHAVLGADFLCTDRWAGAVASCTPPDEAELRLFRVTEELLEATGRPGVAFLHLSAALPPAAGAGILRPRDLIPGSGAEVADAVLGSGNSLLFMQAVNRAQAAQAYGPKD